MKTHTCINCGETKEITLFVKRSEYRDGYSNRCKICSNRIKNEKYPFTITEEEKKRRFINNNKQKVDMFVKKQYEETKALLQSGIGPDVLLKIKEINEKYDKLIAEYLLTNVYKKE